MENLNLESLQALLVTYGTRLLGSIAILVIGWYISRRAVDFLKRLLVEKADFDQTLVSFFGNILYYILLALVVITALDNLGLPTEQILVVFGAASLALGLALQDSVGNLAAGIAIILLRPYSVGDFVEINGTTGWVTDLKLFHTRIKTRDNKIIFVPNSDALDDNITNYSKEEWVRLDLVYGIGYGDDLLRAKQILEEIVQADERVARDPAPTVSVQALADSSVNFAVRPYVKIEDYVPVSFAITEQVKLRFDAEGISIPFPQHDVHLFQSM